MPRSDLAIIRPGSLQIEKARAVIAKCRSVDEAKDIRDQAMVFQVYLRTQQAGVEAQNHAAEIALRAERRMGEILAQSPKNPGGRPRKTGAKMGPVPTLKEIGLTKKQAARAQQLASIPEEDFSTRVVEVRDHLAKLTAAAVLDGKPRRADGKAKSKSEQCRRTPKWLFDYLDERFGPFQLDAFADENNALCENYFDGKIDACTQPWIDVTFCNPEFKDMWSPLALAVSFAEEHAIRSIFLAPVGCSQEWYHQLAIRGTIWVPDMRISYDLPDGEPTDGADRDSIIIALGKEHQNPAWRFGAFRVARLELAEHCQRIKG